MRELPTPAEVRPAARCWFENIKNVRTPKSMFLAEWIAWMESARRDLYFEPGRRRFWEGLGRSGLEGEESALRGLVRCALEMLEKPMVFIDFRS